MKNLAPEHFEVQISHGSVLKWLVIAIAIAVVLTFPKLNHWKSKQNGSHFYWISNSFGQNVDKMAAILFKTENH